ncbi:MAG: geranylgeranyl reductase family protein [Candidatus Ranarchaeia archaeon]
MSLRSGQEQDVIFYISTPEVEFMKQSEDVVIVGGGPSGAYCAFNLARQGIEPVILDQSHPREKRCGGGISPAVLKKFPFVEKFRSRGFTFGNFKIISCIDTQVITKSLENGFCISRKCFDQGILEMAIQNGAKIVKEKVLDVREKGKIWNVITNKTIFSTKVLVGADGVNSIVRRKTVGPISTENLALTFGYITTSLEKDNATIRFLAEIPGYIWVFPGKDYSNIGLGSELKHGRMLKSLIDAFINSHFPRIKIISRYAAMLPSASNPKFFRLPCAGANWILIGDAAGHVDPISGGGILYALWGGELAAQAIESNDLKSFDKTWKEAYGGILEERCKNKEAFYDPLKSTISMFIGLANKTYFWPPT